MKVCLLCSYRRHFGLFLDLICFYFLSFCHIWHPTAGGKISGYAYRSTALCHVVSIVPTTSGRRLVPRCIVLLICSDLLWTPALLLSAVPPAYYARPPPSRIFNKPIYYARQAARPLKSFLACHINYQVEFSTLFMLTYLLYMEKDQNFEPNMHLSAMVLLEIEHPKLTSVSLITVVLPCLGMLLSKLSVRFQFFLLLHILSATTPSVLHVCKPKVIFLLTKGGVE
jgi:hypothetical protein